MVVRLDRPEQPTQLSYTIVAVFDGHRWSALCRELDIASDGTTADEAAQNVLTAVLEALSVAAEAGISAGSPVPDSELLTFLSSHVGPEAVSAYSFSAEP